MSLREIDAAKQAIRQRVWRLLEEKNVAAFPRPVYGRIPNFVGARKAAENLASLDEFRAAKVIKVNPDSPQRYVRELALRAGKIVLVPTPRLRGQFYLLDPSKVDPVLASTITGFTRLGEKVNVESAPKIDLVVVGSVAVSLDGNRVGKGEGYSELEYAMLRETGKVDDSVPIATTVHDLQIVDNIPSAPYDVPVDIISTPTRVIRVMPRRQRPTGIMVEYLSTRKIEETPYLKYYLLRTGRLPRATRS
ncbi:MAG: 5-formyltetrahydrofolate cyclo-ligase [Acidilobus sp.]